MLISTALANPSDKNAIEAAQEILRKELKTSLYEEKINNAFITKQQLIEAVVQNCPEATEAWKNLLKADKAWKNLLNKQSKGGTDKGT